MKTVIELLITLGLLFILVVIAICIDADMGTSAIIFFFGGQLNATIIQTFEKMNENIKKDKDKDESES